MKKLFLSLLLLTFSTSLMAQDTPPTQKPPARRGDAAGYTSRNATVFSVMGWGIALGAGIATLCALVSNGGSNDHAH
ncbi:MAG TPA: hypothetical protein VGM34_03450 [Chlamydiales bacterium]